MGFRRKSIDFCESVSHFVNLYPMLHIKFQGNRSTGSGEEGFLRPRWTIKGRIRNQISVSGEPGLVDRVLALHAGSRGFEVEGSTPTGGTCPNDFSHPIDQDIRTQ